MGGRLASECPRLPSSFLRPGLPPHSSLGVLSPADPQRRVGRVGDAVSLLGGPFRQGEMAGLAVSQPGGFSVWPEPEAVG